MPHRKLYTHGFTLLEMLLVVAIIAVLAGIAIVAINPGKQLATVRNTERTFNLNEIHKAMQQYYIDHYTYPAATPTTLTEICNTGSNSTSTGIDCTGLIDLSPLVPTYLTSIPVDPQGSTLSFINNFIPKVYATTNGTGYKVMKDTNNKIVLTAPQAELSAFIAIGTTTPSEEEVVACPATGGETSTDGDYCLNTFTTVGEDSFVVPSGSLDVEVLVVAGGGGGGFGIGGGAGAGGLVSTSTNISGAVTVTIGVGGAGSLGMCTPGENGGSSIFESITTIGGGGGGSDDGIGGGCSGGTNGGSGGGNSFRYSDPVGTGQTGQGYAGGTGLWGGGSNHGGGGGGGANAIGENAVTNQAGKGGNGKSYDISGTTQTYAGGGGGGGYLPTGWHAGLGGTGGGGNGTDGAGTPGLAGTYFGSGGGGGGGGGGSYGGNGYQGIVIVRYLKQI